MLYLSIEVLLFVPPYIDLRCTKAITDFAYRWGQAVNDAVSKLLQFQLTVNITAVLLTFVSAVSNPDVHSVLTAVQLLFVNFIMDTFAALALATDPPTPEILNRKPAGKKAPLITNEYVEDDCWTGYLSIECHIYSLPCREADSRLRLYPEPTSEGRTGNNGFQHLCLDANL